jgi:glycosyltransferase involved in cell wall biosynthesis
MKILIVSDQFPPYAAGGAASIAVAHAQGLQALGHTVTVFSVTEKREGVGWGSYNSIPVYYAYSSYHPRWRFWYFSLFHRRLLRELRSLLGEVQPEVVHFHNAHQHISYAALKIAKQYGARVFMTLHDVMQFSYAKLTDFINPHETHIPEHSNYRVPWWIELNRHRFRYNPFRNVIIRQYLGYADKLFAVSAALKDAHEQNGIRNIEVVHNGIDLVEWDAGAEQSAVLSKIAGKRVVLFVGRIIAEKGVRELLAAFRMASKKNPEALLVFVGPRTEDRWTKEALRHSGIEDRVVLIPPLSRNELKALYRMVTLVTVPSICFDSFPTINLEAMASRKPVVATCFGGSVEVVKSGETGYIVNPFNTEAFARAMEHILNDPSLAQRMGIAGRARVENTFTLRHQLEHYLSWYGK